MPISGMPLRSSMSTWLRLIWNRSGTMRARTLLPLALGHDAEDLAVVHPGQGDDHFFDVLALDDRAGRSMAPRPLKRPISECALSGSSSTKPDDLVAEPGLGDHRAHDHPADLAGADDQDPPHADAALAQLRQERCS